MTPRWDWLSSTLLAFINGYDRTALNAPEQRQQHSALTMAEEDDARIRILQSLRGKICKCDSRPGGRSGLRVVCVGGGARVGRGAEQPKQATGRGAACSQQPPV